MNAAQFLDFIGEHFPLTDTQKRQFTALEDLYCTWNGQINVISRKDIDHLYDHHVLHSVAVARYLQGQPAMETAFQTAGVLDLGTGGGFPGIPLAILYPAARFTLCDSVGKKLIVAKAVAEGIGLQNVTFTHARAETLPGKFGFIVSRAVASLPDFYPWVKGRYTEAVLYLKGGDVVEEIASVMARYRLPKGSVGVWKIADWLPDPYYEGKLVIKL